MKNLTFKHISLLLFALLTFGFNVIEAQTQQQRSSILNEDKEYFKPYYQTERNLIKFPKVGGYDVMICDFHSHTMFSDGLVWPTFRVQEAWLEGLDALAITDHIEYRPFKKYLNSDHNTSYDIAKEAAKEVDLILIKGSEITRKQSVMGHFNALFLEDSNPIAVDDPKESIRAAKSQGAFVIWNHPGWAVDTTYIRPFQQEVIDEGLINGVEVFNSQEFYPKVVDWALEKNLTIIAASDVHGIVDSESINKEGGLRPVTLVLVKKRSLEGIKEALLARRTLALFNNRVAASEANATAFVNASLTIIKTFTSGKNTMYTLQNLSPVKLEITIDKKDYTISANSRIMITLPSNIKSISITVNNFYIGNNKSLAYDLQIK